MESKKFKEVYDQKWTMAQSDLSAKYSAFSSTFQASTKNASQSKTGETNRAFTWTRPARERNVYGSIRIAWPKSTYFGQGDIKYVSEFCLEILNTNSGNNV